MCEPNVEDRIHRIGRAIFARANSLSGFASPIENIDQALMGWSMRNESFKSQLFRFVDCLPSLRSPDDIARHLREYLNIRLPGFSPLLAAAARFGAGRMARKFIAAPDLDRAVKTIERLRRDHLSFTIDLLGEAVISESEAQQYQQKYLDLVGNLPSRLTGPVPRANVSIKLSSLYSQFDPLDPRGTIYAVLKRLRPILRLAREHGVFINLDMEQFAFKDLTIQIFKSVLLEDEFRNWKDVGIAIQAYLRGSLDDLRDLADWSAIRATPVWIRLVKGAYWDYETIIAAQNGWPIPVFTEKADTDANFEAAAKFLIENRRLLRPAIASHNVRSIAAAIADALQFGANNSEIEFQMLFGMADNLKAALAEMNYRVRVYCPVGEPLPGMAYLVRRLLENTSNQSFLRAGFIDHAPEEQLLMNPTLLKPSSPPRKQSMPDFLNEPPTDFSLPGSRDAMDRALAKFSARSPADYPLLIANRAIFTGQWIESINPSHKSRTVARCACALADHAEQAVAVAKLAFSDWRDVHPSERASLLDRVADILHRDRFDLAAIEIVECGKPRREADADIAEAIDFCRYYAMQMRKLTSPAGADIPGETNQWVYESRGPAVVIAPWNFPLAILTGMAAAAVVAGNPVILKPAEQSPLIAYRLARAFEEAGAPAGVVNYLPGIGEEIGPKLVSHPDVAMIAFTGSRAVGLSINHLAAEPRDDQHLVKRVIVEMGGKNAVIVDADADLDDAVSGVVASAFGYSGQKCSACSRVVILAPVYDAFLRRLVEAAASLKIAPAEDPACRIGPVIDLQAQQRILAAIERGKLDSRLAFAGDVGQLANEGFYVAPHIFAEVPPNSPLANDEIFGPVLAAMKAQTLDEALTIANGVQYALTGGIFSRSPANIARARREFRVGNLYINRRITGALVGRQPFGGFKLSGGGTQAGGPDYLRHFLIPRCITENVLRHGFAAESDVKA
jgi:RHH-type transcriptional regulator, proline utilization regulon repressor / proline dehydrogenase / delta 1-pyrroline-5-carboxylate dehydrogenase